METKKDLAVEVANLYSLQGEWTEEDYFSQHYQPGHVKEEPKAGRLTSRK
jgi:hypothetical protein